MSSRKSDLEQANAEKNAAEERLTLALEAAGLSVWDLDIPTGKLEFQPPIEEILGYPNSDEPTQIMGRKLTHPDDVAVFERDFAEHAAGRTPRIDNEFRMRHFDGSWRWVHCRGEIVARDDNAEPIRVIGTFADVTERIEELADRQFLSDLTFAMVQKRDPASVVSVAIKKLAKHLGAERVGISELQEDWTSLLTRSVWSDPSLPPAPANHRTAYTADVLRTCLAGPVIVEDVQSDPRTANPQTLDLYRGMDIRSIINISMQAEGRKPIFFFVHSRAPRKWKAREVLLVQQVAERLWDSVNRASAEGERETADELLDMAFEVAKVGAFERDLRTGDVRVSKDFFKLIGHPEMQSGGLADYITIIHQDDRENFVRKIATARALREEYELTDEHRILTSSGDIRYIAYRSRTHYEKDSQGVNRLTRAAAIVQDITNQRRQEAEATAARERLNKMSRLTAMGTMASTLSHELNQPLTTAANYLNVLKALDSSEQDFPGIERAEVLDLATRSVLDAGKIIKRIRNFTSGGGPQRRMISLRTIVEAAARSLRDQSDRKVPVIADDVPERLMVKVDDLQIEQVLFNLMRNAAEAMARRKDGRITISAEEADGHVNLRVSDNGPGIPDDFAANLFSPFHSSKRAGLGLGLSLCRTMVEAHGGRLLLQKHDATGCDFLIQLPVPARSPKTP